MKPLTNCVVLLAGVLPALSFVIPDERVTNQVFLPQSTEDSNPSPKVDRPGRILDLFREFEANFERKVGRIVEEIGKFEEAFEGLVAGKGGQSEVKHVVCVGHSKTAIDDAFEAVKPKHAVFPESYEYWDAGAWVSHYENSADALFANLPYGDLHHGKDTDGHGEPEDGTDPGDGPPYHRDPHTEPPHHTPHPPGRHHGGPQHPPGPPMPPHDPHGPHPNETLFDLISRSKYTTILYSLIRNDTELTKLLKDKKSNTTFFVPTNEAFKRLPHDPHKVPRDALKRTLLYHLANGTHNSLDLIHHNTLITKLPEDQLGKGVHQRLRIGLGWHGPTINFYSKIVMVDIFASNGVIHAIDSLLLPPPTVLKVIQVLPTEFSTSETAFSRTGLLEELQKKHNGFTLFLPSNLDWQRLGFKLNAFLFSERGNKYLKALMKYHIVPGHTLYSDAHVIPGKEATKPADYRDDPNGLPPGYSHVYLPTLLGNHIISVDITRFDRFLSFRVNGRNSIVISDVITKNGAIQVPDHVLMPSCKGRGGIGEEGQQQVGEMDVETFQACLRPVMETDSEL